MFARPISLRTLALLTALASAPALAQSAREEALSAGIERPARLAAGQNASAEDVAELIAVYERAEAPRHARLRALSALGEAASAGEATAQGYLHELLRRAARAPDADALHPARSSLVLTRALRGFRAAPRLLATSELSRCLSHDDATVRRAAVEVLANERSERATSLLRAQRARERSPLVLRALTQSSAHSTP